MSRPTMSTAVASWRAAWRWRSAVGVAAELAVVRPPRVGRFDDPAQPECEPVRVPGGGLVPRRWMSRSTSPRAWRRVGSWVVVAAVEGDTCRCRRAARSRRWRPRWARAWRRRCGWRRRSTSRSGSPNAPTRPTTSSRVWPGQQGCGRFLRRHRALCEAAVDRHDVEVQLDDAVVAGDVLRLRVGRTRRRRSTRRDVPAASCRTPRSP